MMSMLARPLAAFAAIVMVAMIVAPVSVTTAATSLPPMQAAVLSRVNGTEAYDLDLALETITKAYPAYRSSGSAGANASADWIFAQMQAAGLAVHIESYSFPSWDLRSRPSLHLAVNGDLADQANLLHFSSFNCEQWSAATAPDGSVGGLVALPLPAAASRSDLESGSIDQAAWDAIDTTGKIVLIGREVRWVWSWDQAFFAKIAAQRPAAIISPYSYSWMAEIGDALIGSAAGPSMDRGIPSGVVNYSEGQELFALANRNTMASVCIDSYQFEGEHFNVVGIIPGSNGSREVLITSHYDSVTTNGFGDNGAGVAGMLESARVLGAAYRDGWYAPIQDIVFVAFDSEELGLVGSLHYVSAHQTDISRIDAVLNLDCIGNREMAVTPTDNSPQNDIKLILHQAAADLGISITDEAPGGSDQVSFTSSWWVRERTQQLWNVSVDIDVGLVNGNAVMVSSLPAVITDLWSMNETGWIHTAKDASSTPGWVSPLHLQEQLSVSTLAVMRLTSGELPHRAQADQSALLLGTMVLVATAGIVLFAVWRKRR